MPKNGGTLSRIFDGLWLLLWKNWLVRRRRLASLIWEFVFLLLVLIVCIIIWKSSKAQSENSEWSGLEDTNSNTHESPLETFKERYESNLLSPLFNYRYSSSNVITYAPNTGKTEELIQRLILDYKNTSASKYRGIGYEINWLGFGSENELVSWFTEKTNRQKQLDYFETRSPMRLAIVFDLESNPKEWTYKLRFVQKHYDNYDCMFQKPLFPPAGKLGTTDSEYRNRGFLGFQYLIDRIIIKMTTGHENITETISLQGIPYPAYTFKSWEPRGIQSALPYILPPFIIIPYLVTFILTVKWIIEEKESGFKELLKINGLPNWMHWMGWMMNSMLSYIFIAAVLAITFSATNMLEETNGGIFFLLLLAFGISMTTFSFFLSSLFQRPAVGSWISFLIWLATLGVAVGVVESKTYEAMGTGDKYAVCIIPSGAIWLAAKIIANFKRSVVYQGVGEDAAPTLEILDFNLGHVFFILVASSIVYLLLALYFESIIPSKFGTRKSWYFPFKSLVRLFKRDKSEFEWNVVPSSDNNISSQSFEQEPIGLQEGMWINKLSKTYWGKKVVDGVSLNVYKGQITALLGPNGAGKTTLIGMLTGITRPSSGTALINNCDIITDLENARENLSVCPQENRLLPQLTVSDHFQLFGKLKGLSSAEAQRESANLASKMGLVEKLNVPTAQLSGGQKRKVQLGMSIIGNKQVVFLDEPTSGMDPESRRHIWTLLAGFRKDRAIVLTTHHMEEADVLGDRIAIMSEGKLKCCGSSLYLKKLYGQGYTLRITIPDTQNSSGRGREGEGKEILTLLQKHIPDAKIIKVYRDAEKGDCQLDINIPTVREGRGRENSVDIHITSKFPKLFSELEENKERFSIKTMGLAYTTMDDVFEKMAEDLTLPKSNQEVENANGAIQNPGLAEQRRQRKKQGNFTLFFKRLQALVVKKLLIMINSRGLLACQILLTLSMFIIALVIMGQIYAPPKNETTNPLKIDLSAYGSEIQTYLKSSDPSLSTGFENAVKALGGPSPIPFNGNLTEKYIEVGAKDINYYTKHVIVGVEMNEAISTPLPKSAHIRGHWSAAAYHTQPLALNLISNTILQSRGQKVGSLPTIRVINHPIKSEDEANDKAVTLLRLYNFSKNSSAYLEIPDYGQGDFILTFVFALLTYFGLAILASSFVVLPVEEKLSKAKQIQRMAGAGPETYFLSFLICDLGLVMILSGVLVALVPIMSACGVELPYNNGEGLGVLYFIFVMFGLNVICLSYWFSLRASSPAGGFIFLMLFHCFAVPVFIFFMAVIGACLALTGQQSAARDTLEIGSAIALIFPSAAVINSLQRFGLLSLVNTACDSVPLGMLQQVCSTQRRLKVGGRKPEVEVLIEMCCSNCIKNCFEPLPYLPKMTANSIPLFILILFLETLFFIAFVLLTERGYGLTRIFRRGVTMVTGTTATFLRTQDEDVQRETQRVDQALASSSGETRTDALYASHFCKNYNNFLAVSDISFGVKYGECFGLLGVNGAGKTSTFKMLTGDEIPSSGDAVIEGNISLINDRENFLRKVGFCPQFDAILGALTGRQMLKLICQLRGVYDKSVEDEAQKWLVNMGLEKSGDLQCGNYSGGMKRRLSAAMALIGNPPVVFLDEPTTGVDPNSRRSFWKILAGVQSAGQAIILTSHSMDECEFLCNRLGLMVNGQMQCFGSVEHLKQKFAQGYTITIKLKTTPSVTPIQNGEQNDGIPLIDFSPTETGIEAGTGTDHGQNTPSSRAVTYLKQRIEQCFARCELKDEHQNILQYQVTTASWTRIFTHLEDLKQEAGGLIEEYSVSETTLEQIFLSFARQQYPARESEARTRCAKCLFFCGLG